LSPAPDNRFRRKPAPPAGAFGLLNPARRQVENSMSTYVDLVAKYETLTMTQKEVFALDDEALVQMVSEIMALASTESVGDDLERETKLWARVLSGDMSPEALPSWRMPLVQRITKVLDEDWIEMGPPFTTSLKESNAKLAETGLGYDVYECDHVLSVPESTPFCGGRTLDHALFRAVVLLQVDPYTRRICARDGSFEDDILTEWGDARWLVCRYLAVREDLARQRPELAKAVNEALPLEKLSSDQMDEGFRVEVGRASVSMAGVHDANPLDPRLQTVRFSDGSVMAWRYFAQLTDCEVLAPSSDGDMTTPFAVMLGGEVVAFIAQCRRERAACP
jgi:hypothetical protein